MKGGETVEGILNVIIVAGEGEHARGTIVGTIRGRVDGTSDRGDFGMEKMCVSKRLVVAERHVICEEVGKPGAPTTGKGVD